MSNFTQLIAFSLIVIITIKYTYTDNISNASLSLFSIIKNYYNEINLQVSNYFTQNIVKLFKTDNIEKISLSITKIITTSIIITSLLEKYLKLVIPLCLILIFYETLI